MGQGSRTTTAPEATVIPVLEKELYVAHHSLAAETQRQWEGCRRYKTLMLNCRGRVRNDSLFSFVKLIS